MKTLAFFALLVFASNAFNLTAYHLGVDNQLNFTDAQVQQGLDCLGVLSGSVEQISELLHSDSFDNIASNLGSQIEQVKADLETSCLPYFVAYAGYVYQTTGDNNLKQNIEQNFHQYYPELIQQIALWESLIAAGQDFEAGQTQSYIGQILIGVVQPVTFPEAQLNATEIVSLNYTAFVNEYLGTVFKTLGINTTVNVSSVIQCSVGIQNATLTSIYLKQKFSAMDFEQKLDAVQYLVSLGFAAIRNCEGAAEVDAILFVPIYEAFKQDPITFTLEVIDRIALNLPQYISSIKQELVYVEEGEYTLAGQLKAQRILNDFNGLVNFTSTA